MIDLIVQFYKVSYNGCSPEQNRARQNEITGCFKANLKHSAVRKIHFLYEKIEDVQFLKDEGVDIDDERIVLYDLGSRLRYSDVFRYANSRLKDHVCVYLHSDMVLERGFELLGTDYKDDVVYALTSHNPDRCNRNFVCHCTRQFSTSRGWYGVTYDGFVFKSGINEKIYEMTDYLMNHFGAENLLIYSLKTLGYRVLSPNNILMAYHFHRVKVFNNTQHKFWINAQKELKPMDYYSNIHRSQNGKSWEEKIVGGGLPFFMGSSEIVKNLV